MATLWFNKFFPPEVVALVSDRSINFTLPKKGKPFSRSQEAKVGGLLKHPAAQVINIRQVHGRRIVIATHRYLEKEKIAQADGIITNVLNLPVAVRTADCVSVFIFDPKKRAIGLVHAGWKGTKKQIVPNAITQMQKKFGSKKNDLKIIFGPSIRSCCYQVGEGFKKHFPGEVTQRSSGLYLDLPLVNKNQLAALGVPQKNIYDCALCTFCNHNFFSYRREGERAGRMISLLMLRG